nr:thioredoxin family protein [uncultured Cohaesibacter sp.]
MVEQEGCIWCARWNKEIGPVYPKTEEGKQAPLRRFDKHDPLPDGIHVTRGFFYTPTFVLLVDGQEKGRIEGYPGEDFFWGLLDQLVASVDKTGTAKASH